MEIDLELTEKSAKNTQRWWELTATIDLLPLESTQKKVTFIPPSASTPNPWPSNPTPSTHNLGRSKIFCYVM